jgi:hypothetical protein
MFSDLRRRNSLVPKTSSSLNRLRLSGQMNASALPRFLGGKSFWREKTLGVEHWRFFPRLIKPNRTQGAAVIVVQDSKGIFRLASKITNVELQMWNLITLLLLCAVSEVNCSLHLRVRAILGRKRTFTQNTATVATHTCQDDPEPFFPLLESFFVFLSHKFWPESEISDSSVGGIFLCLRIVKVLCIYIYNIYMHSYTDIYLIKSNMIDCVYLFIYTYTCITLHNYSWTGNK